MITDKQIAIEWLNQAIYNRYSEIALNGYIRFMDSLSPDKRKLLLTDPDLTKLIDKINKYELE